MSISMTVPSSTFTAASGLKTPFSYFALRG